MKYSKFIKIVYLIFIFSLLPLCSFGSRPNMPLKTCSTLQRIVNGSLEMLAMDYKEAEYSKFATFAQNSKFDDVLDYLIKNGYCKSSSFEYPSKYGCVYGVTKDSDNILTLYCQSHGEVDNIDNVERVSSDNFSSKRNPGDNWLYATVYFSLISCGIIVVIKFLKFLFHA